MSAPERSAASTTTVIAASAAMIRLRAGKHQRHGGVPGGSSETTAPARHPAVERALCRRVGPLGGPGEHGHRRPAGVQRARVGGGVDPERHAADAR